MWTSMTVPTPAGTSTRRLVCSSSKYRKMTNVLAHRHRTAPSHTGIHQLTYALWHIATELHHHTQEYINWHVHCGTSPQNCTITHRNTSTDICIASYRKKRSATAHTGSTSRPGDLQAGIDSSPVSERPRTTVSVGLLRPSRRCWHSAASAFHQSSTACSTSLPAKHLQPSGFFGCWPHSLELSPGFHPWSDHQIGLFQTAD